MDLFKSKQMCDIGPGGFHCPCCNRFRTSKNGKDRGLNKKARKKLKQDIKKELY